MKPSSLLLLSFGLVAAAPAVAESANDAPTVTVLRGASTPPAAAPPVIVQTVVSPQIVYLPAYDPDFSFYPGYFSPGFFVQPQGFTHRSLTPTVRIKGTTTGQITGATSGHK